MFFLGGAAAIAIMGNVNLFFVPLLLGILGLYIPDREVAAALKKRLQVLYVEMAFALNCLAMMVVMGDGAEQAIWRVTEQGGGLFVIKMHGVVDDLNSKRRTKELFKNNFVVWVAFP